MNILVVDDDRIVLQSCKRIFEAEGFRVSLSSSAGEAIEILEKENFQLLIVDVVMPEYDGIYLIEQVHKRWPDLPTIVMSGYPTKNTVSEGLRRGAAHFIAKPFTPDELLEAVQKVQNMERS